MKKIVLISCVSKKLKQKSKTKDLYISSLFKHCLKYAFSLKPDKIYVLSAKYGLLDLEQEVEPYEQTLNNMKKEARIKWAKDIIDNLKKETNLQEDEFIFLAGKKYRVFLIPNIKKYKIPMEGLGIGKQLKFLKDNTK